MDWDKFSKDQKIDGDLAKNRKDGYIAKKNFLDDVNDREYLQKREVEKHQLATRK